VRCQDLRCHCSLQKCLWIRAVVSFCQTATEPSTALGRAFYHRSDQWQEPPWCIQHPVILRSDQSTCIYHCTCTKSNQPVLLFFAGKSTLLIFPRVLNLKLYTCTAGAQPCSALLGMPGAPSAECLEPLQGTHHFSCFEHLKGESFVKAM